MSDVQIVQRETFDVAFLDIRLGPHHPEGGITLLREIRKFYRHIVVIMMTSVEENSIIDHCIALEAAWYIIKPFDVESLTRVMTIAQRYHLLYKMHRTLKVQAGDRAVTRMVLKSKSPHFQKVIEMANRLKGNQEIGILLLGENGVGKEVLAKYLWSLEGDDARPFVPVHIGAIPQTLVESELFGHCQGAFTDASSPRTGKFEYANGGDLFLDEVATMSANVQQTLLRVLQEKKVTPTGSNQVIPISCRVICATNGHLKQMVQEGRFREDLYFRIHQATLIIPPLRHRKEDIPELIDQFLNRYTLGKKRLSKSAFRLCLDYDWPGNIRQLENALRTLAVMVEGSEISKDDLETQVFSDDTPAWEVPKRVESELQSKQPEIPFVLDENRICRNYRKVLLEVEQTMVSLAMKKTGSKNSAAAYLGLPRTTLNSKTDSWGWMEEPKTRSEMS